MFALMQFVQSIFVFLGPLLMTLAYEMSLTSAIHGAIYIIAIAILIFPAILTW